MEDTGKETRYYNTGTNTPLTPPPTDPELKNVHDSFHSEIDGDVDISFPNPGPALEAKPLFTSESQKSDVRSGEADVLDSQEVVSQSPTAPVARYSQYSFDDTIESIHQKTFQIESLPSEVMLYDGTIETREEMVRRAKLFLKYYIPGGYPEHAVFTVNTIWTNLREIWYWARKYAYYGMLENYTSGTTDIFAAKDAENAKPKECRFPPSSRYQRYEHGAENDNRPERAAQVEAVRRRMQPRAEAVRQRMQVSNFLNTEPPVRQNSTKPLQIVTSTPRVANTFKKPSPLTPTSMPRVKITATTKAAGKRKSIASEQNDADYQDDEQRPKRQRASSSASVQSKGSKGKSQAKGSRHAWDVNENNNRASPSERFCKYIKMFLNDRSDDKENWKAFQDAIVPSNDTTLTPYHDDRHIQTGRAPETYGDSHDLQQAERSLCHRLHIKYDEYRCQKNRLFLGLALMVEQNTRMLAANPNAAMWNVGPAQAQLYGSMDANKLSTLWRAFISWGWVHDMQEGNSKTKKGGSVSQEYLNRFPSSYRTKLINEMIEWEEATVTNRNNHTVQRV